LTKQCQIEKADFKQEYIKKYDEDIAKFTEKINALNKESSERIKNELNQKCASDLESISADLK
jgi:hypothetical protein